MTAPTTPFLDGLKSLNSIMAQAQVFASAWSSVGGPFDNGDMLESAEREKAELREEVAAALLAGLTRAALAAPASQWLPIESAPKDEVLMLAGEFGGLGDWRMKCGYYMPETGTWCIWGASWKPALWQPMPAAPSAGPAEQGEQG